MPVQPEDLNAITVLSRVSSTLSLHDYTNKIYDARCNVATVKPCDGEERSAKEIIAKGIATESKPRIDQVRPFVCLAAKEYHSTQNGQQQVIAHSP